jgi:hypothetical protein
VKQQYSLQATIRLAMGWDALLLLLRCTRPAMLLLPCVVALMPVTTAAS